MVVATVVLGIIISSNNLKEKMLQGYTSWCKPYSKFKLYDCTFRHISSTPSSSYSLTYHSTGVYSMTHWERGGKLEGVPLAHSTIPDLRKESQVIQITGLCGLTTNFHSHHLSSYNKNISKLWII